MRLRVGHVSQLPREGRELLLGEGRSIADRRGGGTVSIAHEYVNVRMSFRVRNYFIGA